MMQCDIDLVKYGTILRVIEGGGKYYLCRVYSVSKHTKSCFVTDINGDVDYIRLHSANVFLAEECDAVLWALKQ